MSVDEDLSLEARARAWLEMAQPKWRLQTMQSRSRFNLKTGEYKKLPTRVRRFLNGTPVSMKSKVLELLKEMSPYSSPVFDLETGDSKYVPTNTFIRKDGPELAAGQDATYTIVQDLRLLDEALDTYGLRDESSCAQISETEYHFDESDIVECPDGSQGVSYQITGVNRDRDTDLYSYAVRKVRSLTVHVPPLIASCDSRKRVTVESWDNVYGEPGAFRLDPVRGGSRKLELPEACDHDDGTGVKIAIARNADCTYRIEIERTDAVTDIGSYFVSRDLYKLERGETTLNAFMPLPKQGVEYNHGLVTKYTSTKNEDGTWNNEVQNSLERTVLSSTVETRKTPRGVTVSRVDTNVLTPAEGISTKFGSWKSTKTQGGLYVNEYVEHVRELIDNLGLSCTDTAFVKTHETQASVDAVPEDSHVPVPENGLVTTWVYDTDNEGNVTRRVKTEQEHTVENAVRRKTWGWLGTTSGFTHRSVSARVAEALLDSGEAGTSVEARLTNGGLFDVEVQSFLRITGLTLGFECQKTVYQHVHEVIESSDAIGEEASAAGGGLSYRRTFSLDTTTGAITKRDTVTTELEVPESRRTVRVTARGKTVRTVKSNTSVRPADAVKPGETTEFEVTPGGRYNVTKEETTPSATKLETGCAKDAFEETDSSVKTDLEKAPDHVTGGAGGIYKESTSRLGDDGLWENRTVEHKENLNVDDGVEVVVSARGVRRTVKTRNAPKPAEPTNDQVGKSLRSSRTRGGLFNVEETTTTPKTGKNAVECAKDAFEHTEAETKMSSSAPSGHVGSAGGGVHKERSSRQGDDGLWETREVTHTEEKNVDDGVEVVVTARGVRRTVKTRSAEKPKKEPGASDVGKALRTSRTKGGLYNVEETTTTPSADNLEITCQEDKFVKSESVTRTAVNKSADHVTGSGINGKTKERRQRKGDDGLWEITDVEHTEQKVEGGLEVTVNARGKRKTVITRQTSSQGTEPGVDDAGKSLKRTVTRGGLFDLEETETIPRESDSGLGCSKDLFTHTHTKSRTQRSKAAEEVPAASNGVTRERRQQLGDDGLWSVEDIEHTEQAVESQRVEVRVTKGGKIKRTTNLQVSSAGSGEPGASIGDIGKEKIVEKTRGGKLNVTVTETTPITGKTQEECAKDAFLHTHSSTSATRTPGSNDAPDVNNGEYQEVTRVLNELGVWEERVTKHTEVERTSKIVNYEDAFGIKTVESVANGPDKFSAKNFSLETLIKSVEQDLTRGMNFSSRVTTETPKKVSTNDLLHFEKVTDKGLAIYYDFGVFRNASLSEVKAWIQRIQTKRYTGGEGSYSNHPSINISPNRFGLWDGSVALTTTFTPKAWASGGTTKDDYWEVPNITIKSVQFVPLSSSKVLKIVTEETHKRGGGVGKDRLKSALGSGAMIKGSQFSFHPSGEAYSFDIITGILTKGTIVDMSPGGSFELWNGALLGESS